MNRQRVYGGHGGLGRGGARLAALLALAACVLAGSRPAAAQADPAAQGSHTFVFVGVPLAEALETLLAQTRLSLVYESEVVAGRTAFCKADRATPEQVLSCVLEGTGLDYARLSSGTYVLMADPRALARGFALAGQVVDAQTGRPLADASVSVGAVGGSTNRDGRFAFAGLRPGPYRLAVTHVAYHGAADSLFIGRGEDDHVAVRLEPRVVRSAPIIVSGFEARLLSDALGAERRTAGELAGVAAPGTPDVAQALSALSGVRMDGALGALHVQGGAANEHRIVLDGAPVLAPLANGGLVGSFSPHAIEQVTVRKAGFGAAHGSQLSGVVEAEHRLGAADGEALVAHVDPLSANVRWGGQARGPRRELTWMLAGRVGLWDLARPRRLDALFRSWSAPDPFLLDALRTTPEEAGGATAWAGPLDFGFNDLHAAARLRLSGLRSVRLSFYRGGHTFSGGDGHAAPTGAAGEAYRWGNRTVQASYEWVQSRRIFLNASAWASGYGFERPAALADPTVDDFNEIGEVGIRLGGDYAASARHLLTGTAEVVRTESDFSLALDPFGAPARAAQLRPHQWRPVATLEDRIGLGGGAVLTAGLRLTYLPSHRRTYSEPRLALQYDAPARSAGPWALRVAAGRYRQFLHAFDVATYSVAALLPSVRFWLPVGARHRPPDAYHLTAAARYQPAARWTLGAEVYYKHQPHLLVVDYGRRLLAGDAPPEEVLTSADGFAYGAAWTARRQGRRFRLDAQYEYAIAQRRATNRFGGAFVPVPWSAPHRLVFGLDLLPHPNLTAAARWQGVFGRRWGFRQGYYDYLEPDPATRQAGPFDFGDPLAHRLPAFTRLDASLAYGRSLGAARLEAQLSMGNVLGRRNVTDWSLTSGEGGGAYVRQPRYAMPRLPSAALRLSF